MTRVIVFMIIIATLLSSSENISLKKGWNLIGSSYEIDLKNSSSECFEGIWKYKNGWSYIKLGSANSIERDRGFWIDAKKECDFLPKYSNSRQNSLIQIDKGWNLIGITKERWFSNIDSSILRAFIYSTNDKSWSNFLINKNNSFLLKENSGIWIESIKKLNLKYLNIQEDIFKGKLIINDEIWDSANVTLNAKKAEGKSDINGNFIIKDLNSNSECLELIATKDGKEPFKANVKSDFTKGIIECENIPIVTTYFSGDYSNTTPVTQSIPQNILESISLEPNSINLEIAESQSIKVVGSYANTTQKDETNNTTFKIVDESIATINSNVITAKSVGNTELIATIGELNASFSIKVSKTLESITLSIEPTSLTILKGENANLKVVGNYNDGTEADLTSSATFISSNENNISIENSGLITAVNEGSSTIEVKVGNFIEKVNLNIITENRAIQSKNIADSYSDLIAPNATVEKFDEKRFCVVRGAIKGIEAKPISNVEISIKEYPEYGSVKSDINGEFAIAIEGGGIVTVRYQKDGYAIVDRQVEALWGDIAIVDDITMLKKDTKVTAIKLDGTKQVHSSTLYSDDRGARATTLVFNGITKATVTKEDGTTEELNNLSVRATEFVTPESMPSDLPPQSAYTFCADLTVDEAPDTAKVEFNKPIVMYVDNFIGFDVGEIVPVGYYDRQKGVWVASKNGVVVKLLDSDSDGVVDSLDSDGDDIADDLNGDGNNGGNRDRNNCQENTNSYVEPTDRTFHEDIAIAGTNLTLHYSSKRVEGYKHQISVTVGDVPELAEAVRVTIEVAGKKLKKVVEPISNQVVDFIWNGRDFRNILISGRIKAKITISYRYAMFYYVPSYATEESFAQLGERPTTFRGRGKAYLSESFKEELLNIPRSDIANGWSFSNHNKWLTSREFESGIGNIKISKSTRLIELVAGGKSGFCGDSGDAKEACLNIPKDIEIDNIGNIYIADYYNNRIRKVDRNGTITTIMGSGIGNSCNNGDLATSCLSTPRSIALDSIGNLYVASWNGKEIYKVDKNGIVSIVLDNIRYVEYIKFDNLGNLYILINDTDDFIKKLDINGNLTTIMGGGSSYLGDDSSVKATDLKLSILKNNILIDKFGNLYFTEFKRIIKIDTNGIASVVAGKLTSPFINRDGELATNNYFQNLNSIAMDKIGNIYFGFKNDIFKIDKNGIISTIVGDRYSYIPNCDTLGSANETCLSMNIEAIAIDNENNLFIVDTDYSRILKVSNISNLENTTTVIDGNLLHEFNSLFNHSKTIDIATKKELNKFEYDEEGRLIASIDSFDNKITINRDESGRVTSIVSPNGHITTLTVNENNDLTSVSYEDNTTYSFTYIDGLMDSMIKPNGESFYHAFDDVGRLISTSDPEGAIWSFDKSVNENSTFVVMNTPEGNEKQYIITQHEDGSFENSTIVFSGEKSSTITSADDSNITSLACEVSRVSKFAYDDELKKSYLSKVITTLPSGLTKIVEMNRSYEGKDFNYSSITKGYSVNSKTTTTTHDIDNSKYITTSPMGRVATSYYDSESLLPIRDEVAGILSTEYSYDSKGRVIATKVGDRNSSYIYNDRGNVESFTNSKGLTTSYQYDLLDRVIKVVKPNSSELHFNYDKMGAMTMFRVPTSAEHNFSYNSLGKNTSYTTPQSRVTTYKYDKDRRLIETFLASKSSILYSYSSGRLSSILTPDWQIDYTYACMNSIASITKGSEVINYSYDGELTTKITQSGSLNQMIEFSYSSDFDIDSITYSGATNSYSYDLDGLLISSSGFTISRNVLNGVAESVEGSTFKLDRVFNGYSEVDSETFSIASTPLYSYEIVSRDSSGRITTKRETFDGNTTEWGYSYDDVGRLVEVSKNSEVVEVYEYDSNGNRVLSTSTERDINATASYYLDDTVETFGNIGYVFDSDGYLKLKNSVDGNVTYSYSRTGELLKVIKEDNTTIEYTHDPLGRRVAKSIDGVVVEKYLWLDRTTLLAVYDGNDNLIQRFNYADSRVPFSMEKDGVTYYLFYDQVGSLRVVSDSGGNVVKEIDYDSFGNILSDSDENLTVPFGFAGGLHDRDINLVRFGFRDYDPYIGKWTARDPILFEGGSSNLYGYVESEPINFIDPEGLAGFNSPGKTTLDAGMIGGASGRFGGGSCGDKWSRTPQTIQDRLTLEAAKNGAGKPLNIKMNDPKYKGMDKYEYKVKSNNGNDSVVHYVKDKKTGNLMDFKFKKHSNGFVP